MAKKALVVGINSYGFPNDLPSCTKDADAFAGVLESVYKFDHIRVLKDGEASKDGLDRGLEWLFQAATTNDRLVVFFSGHGHRLEKGGVIEEGLVLQDGRLFDDHELIAYTEGLPPGVLTVILDCGFSGGIDTLLVQPSGAVEVARTKRWMPTDPERVRHDRMAQATARPFRPFGHLKPVSIETIFSLFQSASTLDPSPARVTSLTEPGAKAMIVSATLEDEAASASTSQTNGLSAFTCYLLHAIKRLGPNRSAIEVVQAAGHELRQLGFRQTPTVKEPFHPEHLGLRSFLTFQPVLFVHSSSTPGGEADEQLTRSIAEAVRTTITAVKEGRQMQTTTGGQTLLGDDIGTIVNTVTPIVASVLQSRTYPSYGAQGSLWQTGLGGPQGGFGGIPPHEISSIVNTVTPVVASLLQSRTYQSPAMGGGGWLPFGQPFSAGFQQTPWSFHGAPTGDLGQVVSTVVHAVLPLLVARQSQFQMPLGGAFGGGFSPLFPGGMSQTGTGLAPHEIAQIVSTVTPIIASLVQSRSYQGQAAQGMPRAA